MGQISSKTSNKHTHTHTHSLVTVTDWSLSSHSRHKRGSSFPSLSQTGRLATTVLYEEAARKHNHDFDKAGPPADNAANYDDDYYYRRSRGRLEDELYHRQQQQTGASTSLCSVV